MPRWRFLWVCQDLSGSGLYLGTAPLDVIVRKIVSIIYIYCLYIYMYINRQVDGWMDGCEDG